jgi:hypothetical protein
MCGQYTKIEWTHAPPFQLIHVQPKVQLSGWQQPLKTHTFSVQVLSKDADKMNKFLCKIYKDKHLYMLYLMKKKFPHTVAKAILKQNKLIKDTWFIVLVGVNHKNTQLKNLLVNLKE